MKKVLLVILLLAFGAGLIFYPEIADALSKKNASAAVQNYSAALSQVDAAAIAEELNRAQAYNNALTGTGIKDPFVPGSGVVLGEDYLSILNLGGTMGYVVIPKISVNLPIHHGTADETLRSGVGHLEGTSLPVGGPSTHAVLTSHAGLTNARLFTDLEELEIGDRFYVHVLDEVLAYQVDQIKVVEPQDTRDLIPVRDKDYVTLVTCTPYGVNSHRLLVRGTRIPYSPETRQTDEGKASGLTQEARTLLMAAAITAAVMLVPILTVVIRRGRRDKYIPQHLTQRRR